MKISPDKCSGCGICYDVCPNDAIHFERGNGYGHGVICAVACTNCGACVAECPKDAIYE